MASKNEKPLLNKKLEPIPLDKKEEDDDFIATFLSGIQNDVVDINKIDSFAGVAQNREQIYAMIDTMAADDRISAILETITEDVVETNDKRQVVWCTSDDEDIAKHIQYEIDVLNIDKLAYEWVYSLLTYGDLYIRLYRESDYRINDELLFGKKSNVDKDSKTLNELLNTADKKDTKLEEDVKVVIHEKDDKYADYVKMVSNPGEMFDLQQLGKTRAFLQAPVAIQKNVAYDTPGSLNNFTSYKLNRGDVTVYGPDEFVHASLRNSNNLRNPEEVKLFRTNEDLESDTNAGVFEVRRGQSLLFNKFRIWRQLCMTENSILLDRVTKSAVTRIIGVNVTNIQKNRVPEVLRKIKSMIEQKTSMAVGDHMTEYTNPGPLLNSIFLPVRDEQGQVNIQTIGGEYDPKQLTDLDHLETRFYGGFRTPKQFFCLRGDTKIVLCDGEEVTIKEMFENKDKYLNKCILSCAEDGTIIPTEIKNIMLTRNDATFLRIHLDNGEYVDVTPDHRMMLRDGSFVEAQNLKENDALMPYYERINKQGRKEILDNKTNKYKAQYRLVAEEFFDDIPKGNQIHHIDENKLNDDITNLENLTVEEHYKRHEEMLHKCNAIKQKNNKELNIKSHGNYNKFSVTNGVENHWLNNGDEIPEGYWLGQTCNISEKTREIFANNARARFTGKEPWSKGQTKETNQTLKILSEKLKNISHRKHTKEEIEKIRNWSLTHKDIISKNSKSQYKEEQLRKERTLCCPCCHKYFTKKLNFNDYNKYLNTEKFYFCSSDCYNEVSGNGKINVSYNLLRKSNFDYDSYEKNRENMKHPDSYFKSETLKNKIEKYNLTKYVPECNHRVVLIEKLDVVENAYDLEVKSDAHTFPVKAGVFVHNCLTDDSTGFNGGSSLTIISSRYGKSIKQYQAILRNLVEDIINLRLENADCEGYIGKFTLNSQTPLTQEEIDRKDNERNEMGIISDILNQNSGLEINDLLKLKIYKELISPTVNNPEIVTLIQEAIDELEKKEQAKKEKESDKTEEKTIETTSSKKRKSDSDPFKDFENTLGISQEPESSSESEIESEEESEVTTETSAENDSYLPSPNELDKNFLDNM